MMTQQSYRALAKTFAAVHAELVDGDTADDAWMLLRTRIADVLAADNPRFDRQRFYAATTTRPACCDRPMPADDGECQRCFKVAS